MRARKPKHPTGSERDPAPSDDDAPVIPNRASDDSDEGWERAESGDSDDERYLRDRPPHWE